MGAGSLGRIKIAWNSWKQQNWKCLTQIQIDCTGSGEDTIPMATMDLFFWMFLVLFSGLSGWAPCGNPILIQITRMLFCFILPLMFSKMLPKSVQRVRHQNLCWSVDTSESREGFGAPGTGFWLSKKVVDSDIRVLLGEPNWGSQQIHNHYHNSSFLLRRNGKRHKQRQKTFNLMENSLAWCLFSRTDEWRCSHCYRNKCAPISRQELVASPPFSAPSLFKSIAIPFLCSPVHCVSLILPSSYCAMLAALHNLCKLFRHFLLLRLKLCRSGQCFLNWMSWILSGEVSKAPQVLGWV